MKVSKILLAIICVVMIASVAPAKVIHGNGANDTLLVIPKTGMAPKLDGTVDQVWDLVDPTWMEYNIPQAGFADAYQTDWNWGSGWAKLMYDDNNLYGLFYVQKTLIDSTQNEGGYQADGCELFIDANHTHAQGSSLAFPSLHFPILLTYGSTPHAVDSAETAMGRGIKYEWFIDTASVTDMNAGGYGLLGYFLEFQLPLDSLGITSPAGLKVSLQFQIDINDGTGRSDVLNWHYSPGNTDWQNTSAWGDAQFSTADPIDTTAGYVFLKTSTPPVIGDFNMASWDLANQADVNHFYDQTVLTNNYPFMGADPQEHDWRFYGLYDDNNLYGHFTVYQNAAEIDSTVNQGGYQADGCELFIDANHTHAKGSNLAACSPTAQHFPILLTYGSTSHAIDSAEAAIGKGIKYAWRTFNLTNPYSYDTVFSSRSGWELEFSIPLDSLGIASPATGTTVSFQLQGDDNDLTPAGRILTSNWWYSAGNTDWEQTLNWGNATFGSNATAVKQRTGAVANTFSLGQNYPNPFNPTTHIDYSIAKGGFVSLKVYNILGQEVSTIFSGNQKAGSYTATFDGTKLASGVYFYKLQSTNQVLAKKLMLLK